jgi:hypothetical protein
MSLVLQVLMLMALSEYCSDERRGGVFRHVYYGFNFLLQFKDFIWGYSISVIELPVTDTFFADMKFLNHIHVRNFSVKIENFHIFHFPKWVAIL